MKLTDIDTDSDRDTSLIVAIADHFRAAQSNILVKKEIVEPKEVKLLLTETSKSEEIVIDNKQVKSIFGMPCGNIVNNYKRNAEHGYGSIIRPVKSEGPISSHRGAMTRQWVLGDEFIKNMKPEDIETLKNGDCLDTPCILSTQLINSAMKFSHGQRAPRYNPKNPSEAYSGAKIFSLQRPSTSYYLTFTSSWKETNPVVHFAIVYYFQQKTT